MWPMRFCASELQLYLGLEHDWLQSSRAGNYSCEPSTLASEPSCIYCTHSLILPFLSLSLCPPFCLRPHCFHQFITVAYTKRPLSVPSRLARLKIRNPVIFRSFPRFCSGLTACLPAIPLGNSILPSQAKPKMPVHAKSTLSPTSRSLGQRRALASPANCAC